MFTSIVAVIIRPRATPTTGRIALTWLASKAVLILAWLLVAPVVQGDVSYYVRSLQEMAVVGPARTLVEYPTPVIWIMSLLRVVTGGSSAAFTIIFLVLMLALDGWFTSVLLHADRTGRSSWWWIGATFLLGPTSFMRFDMLTGVLVGVAICWLVTRPRLAGAAIGLGAGVKVWPAMLWPGLLSGRHRIAAGVTTLATGLGLAVASLLYAGRDRLFSPVTWQTERGLQVESIAATVPMLERLRHPLLHQVSYSPHKAYEIDGVTTASWMRIADVSTILALLVIVLIAIALILLRTEDPSLIGVAMTTMIALFILTNKTFSPQYLLWLSPALVAAHALGDASRRRGLHALLGLLLLTTAFTFAVYPATYDALVREPAPVAATLILAARNLCFLLLTLTLVWRTGSWIADAHRPRPVGSPGTQSRKADA